jgi:hypothetical protein
MKATMWASVLAVGAAAVSAQGAFVDYYNPAGATEVSRWTFDDGTFETFPNGGGGDWNYIHDQVSTDSPLYQGDQGGSNFNHPSGGTLNTSDGKYFYIYPTATGGELKTAVEGGANGFSYYVRYRLNAATERYFWLMADTNFAGLYHNSNGGGLGLQVNGSGDGSVKNIVTSDITAADFADGFHDMLATYDAATGNIEIYLDGVNRGLVFADGVETGVTRESAGLQFNLFTASYGGGAVDVPGIPAAYNLIIDEARVYDGIVVPNAVPEPASVGLLGLAAMMLGRRRTA